MMVYATAALLSLALTPVARYLAAKREWLSHSAKRDGVHPAMSGGVAVLLALAATIVLLNGTDIFVELLPYWIGTMLIFGMGLVDDWAVLTPKTKFVAQVVSVLTFLILMIAGGQLPFSLWLLPFGFWMLGITNSLNLLDNIDGLAAGIGVIAALGFAFIGFNSPVSAPALVFLAMAGSLSGFLVYNFHPARIFLGDSGSHLIGFTLAALPLYGLSSPNPGNGWEELLILPLILVVPICDTTYVTISRLLRGTPVSQGGKDHLSHRLLQKGFSERAVALIFYATAALVTALTVFSLKG